MDGTPPPSPRLTPRAQGPVENMRTLGAPLINGTWKYVIHDHLMVDFDIKIMGDS